MLITKQLAASQCSTVAHRVRSTWRKVAWAALSACAFAATAYAPAYAQSAAAGSNGSLKPLSVQVFTGSVINLPLYVAEKYGMYKENGLSVSFVPISNGPLSVQAVQSGRLDVGMGSYGTVMAARGKGFDLKVVVADLDHNYWSLVGRKGGSWPNIGKGYPAVMKDLVGKRIGVTARGAQSEFDVRTLFAEAGLSPDAATYVGVGAPAQALAALKADQVDAVLAYDPTQTVAMTTGIGVMLVDLRKGDGPAALQAMNGAYQVFFAATKKIESDPAAIDSFIAAQSQAVRWLQDPANREAAYALASDKVALGGLTEPQTKEALNDMLASYRGLWGYQISKKAIDAANQYLLKYNLIPKALDPNELVYGHAPSP